MTVDDLPSLVRSADAAAMQAQRSYFSLLRFEIVLLILGAVGSAVAAAMSESLAAIASVACIVSSLLLGVFSRQQRYDEGWVDWRAVAERGRSLTWRYLTRCSPFDQSAPDAADEAFIRALRDVLEGHRRADEAFLSSSPGSSQLTAAMRSLRAGALPARTSAYRERLREQVRWYSQRAATLQRQDRRWLFLSVGAQATAAGLALSMLVYPVYGGIVGVATAVASVTLAWHQARRYRDLAAAYAMAAQELGLIDPLFDHVHDEDALQRRVIDAEEAISREQTRWLGRRG